MANSHTLGPRTREQATLAARCEELASTGIAVTGLSETYWPYHMTRNPADRDHALICTKGRGEVWQDGAWVELKLGMIYLAPKGEIHAYRAIRGIAWHHVWVIYQPNTSIPMPRKSECRSCEESHEALVHALKGLNVEVATGRNLNQRRLWAGLVSGYWQSIITSNSPRRRLDSLWRLVDDDLAHPWTLMELAKKAGVSDEHLRRLSLVEVGRSPLRQVTWLRLTRASALLQTTRMKLEEIAQRVGYGDAFSFSTAYSRWFGMAPSAGRADND
jgi:AraC-like DNA-binding protein/quercetin dioxygenase-like cupin family protein